MLLTRLSGHMCRGSANESSSSCGNCDGARCDECHAMYAWYGYDDEYFDTPEKAEAYGKEQERLRAELVPNANVQDLSHAMWILKDEKLHAYFYRAYGIPFADAGYVTMPCNENSPLYYDLWSRAVDRSAAYDNCDIADKGKGHHISYCQTFGQCDEWIAPACKNACCCMG